MKLRKICALFLASSLLLSVAACAPNTTVESKDDGGDDASTNTEAKVFSIGHSNPADPDDQYHYFCEELNRNLQEICDGAIQFEIFSDSQYGTETEMFQAVSEGSLDAVCISNNIVSGSIAISPRPSRPACATICAASWMRAPWMRMRCAACAS